jgi:hypothetical protein
MILLQVIMYQVSMSELLTTEKLPGSHGTKLPSHRIQISEVELPAESEYKSMGHSLADDPPTKK